MQQNQQRDLYLNVIFIRRGCSQPCPSRHVKFKNHFTSFIICNALFINNCARMQKGEYFISEKVCDSYSASSMCTFSLLFQFTSASCRRKRFRTCGNQRKIVFVRVSGWISLLYHRVICLHWFKLFPLDMSSFTRMHDTYLTWIHRGALAHAHTHTSTAPPLQPHPL